jgi:DHA2 family multidrug resistance protein-like MFS transporter
MFAVRAVVSTVARLPCGMLAGAVGSRQVMIGALGLELAAILGMGSTERPVALGALLALEGIAFGGFLTAAHAFIAEHTVAETRGAAIGLYSAAGSIGSTLAPLGLGLVATELGLAAVFFVTAGLLVVGLAVLGWMSVRSPAQAVAEGGAR